jgi:hypothetical protein
MDSQGLIPTRGKIFFFSTVFIAALEITQPPIQWVLGALPLGVNQLGHKADHSIPSNTKVKNGQAIPPLLRTSE